MTTNIVPLVRKMNRTDKGKYGWGWVCACCGRHYGTWGEIKDHDEALHTYIVPLVSDKVEVKQ